MTKLGIPFLRKNEKTMWYVASVNAGDSIDQNRPSAEPLYLMRMSEVMRLVSNSRRDERLRSRVGKLARALTTRTGASSSRRRSTPADVSSSTRSLGEQPNDQSRRR